MSEKSMGYTRQEVACILSVSLREVDKLADGDDSGYRAFFEKPMTVEMMLIPEEQLNEYIDTLKWEATSDRRRGITRDQDAPF